MPAETGRALHPAGPYAIFKRESARTPALSESVPIHHLAAWSDMSAASVTGDNRPPRFANSLRSPCKCRRRGNCANLFVDGSAPTDSTPWRSQPAGAVGDQRETLMLTVLETPAEYGQPYS